MTPAARRILRSATTPEITATVLKFAAAIAAITTAKIFINEQLHHQQESCASHNYYAFQSHLIDAVAVVATACCGFLLHARLETLPSVSFHHETATDSPSAGTIMLKPTSHISSLDSEHAACESQLGLMRPLMKQNCHRRGCDGYADEGDEGSIITSETGATAIKKRIALLRGRRSKTQFSPSNALSVKRAADRYRHTVDSASDLMMLQTDEASMSGARALPTTSQPSMSPPRKAAALFDDQTDGPVSRSPLSKALLHMLPGLPASATKSPYWPARQLSKSQAGCVSEKPSVATTSDFWQSLQQAATSNIESSNHPSDGIVEIMSVGCNNPITQRILAKILVSGHGFGYCPVYSGEGALEELEGRYNAGKESLPILILIDTALPGMDGYETTREIRSLFPDVALPIIMLTASSDLEITTFQRAVEAGANDVVSQPITKHNLMARIGCQLKSLHFWRGQLESRQSEFLLNEILPENIITKLKQGHAGCIYDELEEVSVIFTDIVSFTSVSASHPTEEIIHMLDSLFTEFDKLTDKHGLYKVETIGEKTHYGQPCHVLTVEFWYLLVMMRSPFFTSMP